MVSSICGAFPGENGSQAVNELRTRDVVSQLVFDVSSVHRVRGVQMSVLLSVARSNYFPESPSSDDGLTVAVLIWTLVPGRFTSLSHSLQGIRACTLDVPCVSDWVGIYGCLSILWISCSRFAWVCCWVIVGPCSSQLGLFPSSFMSLESKSYS